MSFQKWGNQNLYNTNPHTLSHLKPVDECRKAAVCLERLHVQVSDEVHHSHGSRHKLQPTVAIHRQTVQQVQCHNHTYINLCVTYSPTKFTDKPNQRLRNIISTIKSNIFQDNKNIYRHCITITHASVASAAATITTTTLTHKQ